MAVLFTEQQIAGRSRFATPTSRAFLAPRQTEISCTGIRGGPLHCLARRGALNAQAASEGKDGPPRSVGGEHGTREPGLWRQAHLCAHLTLVIYSLNFTGLSFLTCKMKW